MLQLYLRDLINIDFIRTSKVFKNFLGIHTSYNEDSTTSLDAT